MTSPDLNFPGKKMTIGNSEAVIIPKNVAKLLKEGQTYLFIITDLPEIEGDDGERSQNY